MHVQGDQIQSEFEKTFAGKSLRDEKLSRETRFQDKQEKVRKERQSKPGTKALHERSNQGLVQINRLKTTLITALGIVRMAAQLSMKRTKPRGDRTASYTMNINGFRKSSQILRRHKADKQLKSGQILQLRRGLHNGRRKA